MTTNAVSIAAAAPFLQALIFICFCHDERVKTSADLISL